MRNRGKSTRLGSGNFAILPEKAEVECIGRVKRMATPTDIVTLNVSGTISTTTVSTLTKDSFNFLRLPGLISAGRNLTASTELFTHSVN